MAADLKAVVKFNLTFNDLLLWQDILDQVLKSPANSASRSLERIDISRREISLQDSTEQPGSVLEVAGARDTFQLAWRCARPNATVTVVALYDEPQVLPLPQMYGKNLTFKTGGVDGCDCEEVLGLIEQGKIDTTPLITHRFPLERIEEAYRLFENS